MYALVISSRSFFRLNSISATLCSRVLCSSGICSFLSGLAYYREVDSLLRAACPVALPACYSVVTDSFDSIGKALLSKGEIWQIIAGLLCQIISKMINLHHKGRMPEQQTFLSMINGSFSTPAAENRTVAMIEAAYETTTSTRVTSIVT